MNLIMNPMMNLITNLKSFNKSSKKYNNDQFIENQNSVLIIIKKILSV